MKKKMIKVLSMALVFVMLFSSAIFASTERILPKENFQGGSFDFAIKTTAKNLRITINIEQYAHDGLVEMEWKPATPLYDADGNPISGIKYKVQGTVYDDFTDTATISASALENFSKKLTNAEKKNTKITNTLKLSDFKVVEYKAAETYTNNAEIGLFIKHYENFKAGIYEFVIEELDADGKVQKKTQEYICVKEGYEAKKYSSIGGKLVPEKEDELQNILPNKNNNEVKKSTLAEKITNFIKTIFK